MLHHLHPHPTRPERIVVIGAGFIGGTIARFAREAGTEVVALGRSSIDLLAGDAADKLAARLQPNDAVVFVSALAPAKTAAQLTLNLQMAEAACRAFQKVAPAHLLYISSDAVYADDANPVNEASALAPSTLHGMMHAARELMFRSEYRGPFAALRPTLVFGAGDPHSGYGPNRFRRQGAAGGPITIFGEGEEKRDHIAVEDVARLAVRMLWRRSSGALNAATGVAAPFCEIARIVAAQFAPDVVVQSVPRPGPRPHLLHRFFDVTGRLRAFPDFHPEPLAAALARVHREAQAAR